MLVKPPVMNRSRNSSSDSSGDVLTMRFTSRMNWGMKKERMRVVMRLKKVWKMVMASGTRWTGRD